MKYWSLLFLIVIGTSCRVIPQGVFADQKMGIAPDYSLLANWAAHPDKADAADSIPNQPSANESDLPADIFFIYPTTYIGKKGENQWNACIDDATLNARTDETAILFQASLFNQAGRVFAPRYRQAHYQAYFTRDDSSATRAFKLAYQDVDAAFSYYLEHWNNGRPIIIASHSQGTTHAIPLIRKYFDGKELQHQLVAAYLVGMPVSRDDFKFLPPCTTPDQTGCICSWRTFQTGYEAHFRHPYLASRFAPRPQTIVTNPLSWTTDTLYVPRQENQGSLLFKFNEVMPNLVDAQVVQDMLWVTKPKFPGSLFIRTKNYHIADYNFFYFNVRSNAAGRVQAYLQENPGGASRIGN
ncbi:MAG: DUF3089 domain-containing protein [Saprospiraceae bacterium]|nr:DUF3089 domain-containing protein [Saprospiraceae bacterium]MCB9321253.1 DUF3089 domain-containing protein [Lewinellaceae bacterium]